MGHSGSNGELAYQEHESTNTDADSRVRASVSPGISPKEGTEGGLGRERVRRGGGRAVTHDRKKAKVKVFGARKVWGTLRTTTINAVKHVVTSIARIQAAKFVIKRKYKSSNDTGKVHRWWFVIKADETVLKELDAKWSLVSLQTAWRLENVYSHAPADSNICLELSPVSQCLLPNNATTSIISDTASVATKSSPVQARPLLSNIDNIASQSPESDSTSVGPNKNSTAQCTPATRVSTSESSCLQIMADVIGENATSDVHYNGSDATKDCAHDSADTSFLE